MRSLVLSTARLLILSVTVLTLPTTMSASRAQTPLTPLPSPNLPEGALPSDFLRVAQNALAAGRVGEAEEALERAQTRMLDRSVPLGQTNDPSNNPTVGQIGQARQALAADDRATCMQLLQTAIASATAQGL
jgi:hypothetical protein